MSKMKPAVSGGDNFYRSLALIGAIIFLGLADLSYAGSDSWDSTGIFIAEDCSTPRGSVREDQCTWYLTGVIDSLHFLKNSEPYIQGSEFLPCLPKKMKYRQGFRVITKWVNDNPKHLHHHSIPIIAAALNQSFPCKKEQKAPPGKKGVFDLKEAKKEYKERVVAAIQVIGELEKFWAKNDNKWTSKQKVLLKVINDWMENGSPLPPEYWPEAVKLMYLAINRQIAADHFSQ